MIDDARSFFHRAPSGSYALVVFGFLDSHRLLSAFSSVRLDNFIYTQEAMAEVRRLLVPGGRVALSFASNQEWITSGSSPSSTARSPTPPSSRGTRGAGPTASST